MDNFKSLIFKRPVITIMIIYIFFILILNFTGFFSPNKQSIAYHFTEYKKPVLIEGKIISNPEITKTGNKFILKASKINDYNINEKIMVNMPPAYNISYGDIIIIEGKIKKPFKAIFPLVFDYQKYLARNEIYTVFDVSSLEYITSKPNLFKKLALSLQEDIVKKIDSYFKDPYAAILKPMIIGDQSALNNEIKDSFINAGLMHILVVSGLNVGFIGAIFVFVFKLCGLPLKKASLLSIPFILLFVAATGSNPPALRAGIMFSCILISLSLNREPLIYNSLALSALIILLFEPQQIFTASFQMSYGATIGIVAFYPYIYNLFKKIKNKILKFFCGVFSVTFSAQILIIPLCAFYFGKFSLVSFIANIFIVPTVGIILTLGFIFYISTFILSYISLAISIILSLIMHIIVSATFFFGSLSFASINIAKPSLIRTILFFIFIFSMIFFKSRKRIIIALILFLFSLSLILIPNLKNRNKILFNIYNNRNISVSHIKSSQNNIFMIYQKRKYYDKYSINSLKQFISFSGIKKYEVHAIGFDKNKTLEDFNLNSFVLNEGSLSSFDFNIEDHNIKIDIKNNGLYIDNIYKEKLRENNYFYYDLKSKTFNI